MSFVQRKLVKSVNQSRDIFDKFIYSPQNNDTILDITSAGYMDESRYSDDWVGSIVEVDASDGYYFCQVGSNGDLIVVSGGAPSGPVTSIRVVRGTTQSIPETVATTYIYNEVDYDILSEFNASTGVFTPQNDGVYVVSASITSEESWTAGEKCILELHVNGVLKDYLATVYAEVTGALNAHVHGSCTVSLSAGDTLEVQMYHDRGIALNTLPNGPSMTDGQYNYITIALAQGVTAASPASIYENQVVVTSPNDLSGILDSTKVYFIDGIIDLTGTGISIQVPADGLTLAGHNFDISKLICSDAAYTLFESPVGNSGNLLGMDYAIEITGAGSQVYNLTSATGLDAFEFSRVNYNNCTSMGTINGYRQAFESGTGRFGGSPTLTLAGTWVGGYFIDSSITRSLDAGMTGALFEAGAGFSMSSRFRSNMNTDLPTSASYADFAPSNFPNPSTLQMTGSIVTRDGIVDNSDANIFPNILPSDLAAQWNDNIGFNNTNEGGRIVNVFESETIVTLQNVFYDIGGASLPLELDHFDSPAGFQLRQLGSSITSYTVIFDAAIDGTQNNELALKFEKWDDSAAAFVDVGIQRRPVNNLQGGRDVAFFNGQFNVELDQNDYVKWQVANNTSTANVTLELDSFFIVSVR